MLFHDPDAFLAEVEEIARLGGDRLMSYWRSLSADQVTEAATQVVAELHRLLRHQP